MFLIFLLLFIVVYILWERFTKSEGFATKETIPLNIFQTWNTKDLPPQMKACVYRLRQKNPEFNYQLFDDEDCLHFLKEHFDSNVFQSFHRLKPGAYKADLWRYCVLYIHGGIYLDIKFECCEGFKCIELMDKEHYVMDRQNFCEKGKILVYNGCIVSPPGNPVLLKCIETIVANVDGRIYGFNPLYPTGPGLFGQVLGRNKHIDLTFTDDEECIVYKKKKIFKKYKEYRQEQTKTRYGNHYDDLWKEGDIYHP